MRNMILCGRTLLPAILLLAAAGCSRMPEMTDMGFRDSYDVARLQKLLISPEMGSAEYHWSLYAPDGSLAEQRDGREFLFMEATTGVWRLVLTVGEDSFSTNIAVNEEREPYSPYIAKVHEYVPAPGQFVNVLPLYEAGDTEADMLRKCGEAICGDKGELITLGGYGGYVTFGFDHTVVNVEGEADFRIWGNAIAGSDLATGLSGGSAEPGIVMVSYDINCNGLPDDPWYELKGSAHSDPETLRPYSISYFRPSPIVPQTPSGQYIRWTDTYGNSGYMASVATHTQSYWPLWRDEGALSFTGTRLPGNAIDTDGSGTAWFLFAFDHGYADSYTNTDAEKNSFDISDAIDANGESVALPGIDFVRVYTGVLQQCGWLGETSTEISMARDLHL